MGQPGLRIDIIHFDAGDRSMHHRGALAAAIRTGEQPRFAAQGDASHGNSAAPLIEETRSSLRSRLKTV